MCIGVAQAGRYSNDLRQLEVLAADTAPKQADNLLILIEDCIGVGFPLQAVTTVDRCAKRLE